MKFKENAIKPGMVIHCPKEEDARALYEHLKTNGFVVIDYMCKVWKKYEERSCFEIDSCANGELTTYYGTIGDYLSEKKEITEFSDLIEPDEPQMSAAEVLEWLMKYRGKMEFKECFGQLYAMDILFNLFTAEEILNKITAYEAAKKAPKPVEVEWVDVARIAKIQDSGNAWCVHEEEFPYGVKGERVEEMFKEYTETHDGDYYATVERRCRVKEDK